jgi:hypothetical protein
MPGAMRKIFYLVLFSFSLLSCQQEQEGGNTLLTLLSSSRTNVDFVNWLKETEKFNIIEYLYFNNGAGVAAGDINNDGLPDLFFTASQGPDKLYLNLGGLRFKDITRKAGVEGKGDWKTGVTMADVNGDGLLDIYVCHVGGYKGLKGRNELYINQGDLTFKEQAEEYGLAFQGFSTQAAFFDYDGDGDLDMYLLNHSVHTSRSYGGAKLRNDRDERAGDRLYRNHLSERKIFFTDVTDSAGIFSSQIGYGLGVNICDLNNDALPDIYISNDFHENDYLYLNNGDGTFTEKLRDYIAHTSRSSMGNDVGDFNNDGLPDIVVLDMLPDEEKIRKQSGGEDDYELFNMKLKYGYYFQFVRNTLQLNLGGGVFSEIGRLSGIFSTDWSWSPLFCDVDNDGWKDLFITNGIYRRANDLDYVQFLTGGNRYQPARNIREMPDKDLYEKMPLYPNVNYLFRNNRDLTFTNKAGEWGFRKRSYSNGATYADLDNDGDLELIVNNINEKAFIYRNNVSGTPGHHYLSVAFRGKGLNTRGVGARVTLCLHGKKQMAEQFAVRGFMSSTEDVLHFGLGSDTRVDTLRVRWPGGAEQLLTDLPADTLIILSEEDALSSSVTGDSVDKKNRLFREVEIPGLHFRHREDPFSELGSQPLLPHSMAAEGPALAVGDVNGDGREDLFIGGAEGQEAQIFIQTEQGTFVTMDEPVLKKDRLKEDVDAVFFDADGDGDQDLYVVRGGGRYPAGDPYLEDRLLINDGKGFFRASGKGVLPYIAENGSCVAAGDFDGDGDTDLFVGSRSVPGAYGLPPRQFLLENKGKEGFKDVTDLRAKALGYAGMVTGAAWFDYDGDGDPDLVVAGEWMKIRLFENDKGLFRDITARAGLDETSGWWYSVTVQDMDGDGDPDIIGGNLGLNTLLKASPEEPVELFLNDFDNNGIPDPVICSYQDGVSYPVASLDEMCSQIAGLRERYPNYSDFGGKTITDIFGETAVARSLKRVAVMFRSACFVNDGKGRFTVEYLPVEAQFSPVRDLLAGDFDSDGKTDLLLVGNDYGVRPSLGRYDASYGWFLRAGKSHHFRTLMPVESGFFVKGDSRKIVPVTVGGSPCVVVGVNNEKIRIFRILKK